MFFHRFWSGRWRFGCFCTNTLVFTVHFLYMETRACKAHVLQIVSVVMDFIPINWYFWWQFLMVLYNIYIYKWLKNLWRQWWTFSISVLNNLLRHIEKIFLLTIMRSSCFSAICEYLHFPRILFKISISWAPHTHRFYTFISVCEYFLRTDELVDKYS